MYVNLSHLSFISLLLSALLRLAGRVETLRLAKRGRERVGVSYSCLRESDILRVRDRWFLHHAN